MTEQATRSVGPSPFSAAETHGIALFPGNLLHAHSEGLGWHAAYASFATEQPWSGTLPPLPHFCLAYCLNRSASVTRKVGGRSAHTVLHPRQFGVVPAGEPSTWDLRGTPDILLLYLREATVHRIAEEVFETDAARLEILPRLGEPDALMEQLGLALLSAMRDRESALYADSLAQSLAVQMLRGHAVKLARHPATPPAPARMQHVRDYIEAKLDCDLSLHALAAEAGIAETSFARAFRHAFGLPPHQYILIRRIEQAKALLVRSDLPMVDVALRCGFSSQSHLAAALKKLTGLTPREYRRGFIGNV